MKLLVAAANKRVTAEDDNFIKNATDEINELSERANTLQQLILSSQVSLGNGVRYDRISNVFELIDATALDIAEHLRTLSEELNEYVLSNKHSPETYFK